MMVDQNPKLALFRAIHSEMPGTTPIDILTEPVTGCRHSRGPRDTIRVGSVTHRKGAWGIVRESRKIRDDGWKIQATITPPETDAEVDAIVCIWARRWDDSLHSKYHAAPDDYRDADKHTARRQRYYELRAQLVASGLLT